MNNIECVKKHNPYDIYIVIDSTTNNIIDYNDVFLKKLNYKENINTLNIYNLFESPEELDKLFNIIKKTNTVENKKITMRKKDNSTLYVLINLKLEENNYYMWIKDIDTLISDCKNSIELAEKKYLTQCNTIIKSMRYILDSYVSGKFNISELRKVMLDELIKVTDSKYGYTSVTIYDENNNHIGQKLTTLSDSVLNYATPEFRKKYPLDKESLDTYIFNDMGAIYSIPYNTKNPYFTNNLQYNSNIKKKCPFQPYNEIMRTYVAYPMISGEKIIGIIGLADREDGYMNNIIDNIKPLIDTCTNIELAHSMNEKLVKNKEDKIKLMESVANLKSSFTANMSHEIRTPMNGIYGMLELLKETKLDIIQRDFVTTCLNCAEGLMSVLDDILLYSKADADKIELNSISFNLREMIENICCILNNNKEDSKKLDLVYYIKSDVPNNLIGDSGRLKQILINLVSNGIKFTEVGEVALEVSLETLNPLVLRFDISDTGIGITDEQLKKLFKPYSQADISTSRTYGGNGLGLAICKKLVDVFQGTISVNSRIGRGSTFTVTIPLIINTSSDGSIFDYELEETQLNLIKKYKIYVIDDNSTNCMTLEGIFNNLGCIVQSSRSGIDGINKLKIAKLKNEPFDILLLDYHMPHMNGIEVAKLLYLENMDNLKIITLSSRSDHKILLHEPNIYACVSKPLKRNQLLHMIYYALIEQNINVVTCEPTEINKICTPCDTINTIDTIDTCDTSGTCDALKPTGKKKILIVEDNNINRNVLCKILKKSNFEVDEANNGIEAIKKINTGEKYDLILMDIHMPLMDGIETTKILRNTNKSVIPVIALTADISIETKNICNNVGFNSCIYKPTNQKKLITEINKFINIDNRFNIMIVDDMYTNRTILEKIIKQLDYNITIYTCVNGKEALDLFNKLDKCDIIFMDITMPVMDGIESTTLIKQQKKDQIIIGLTGHDSDYEFNRCRKVGMEEVLVKPVRTENLKNIIIKYLKISIDTQEPNDIIDYNFIKELSSGDIDCEKMFIDHWKNDANIKIQKLYSNLECKNYDNIKTLIHSMKGSSYQLGINIIGNRCKIIEEQLKKKNKKSVYKEINNLNSDINIVLNKFKNYKLI